jgi:AraC family transcriptional regulator
LPKTIKVSRSYNGLSDLGISAHEIDFGASGKQDLPELGHFVLWLHVTGAGVVNPAVAGTLKHAIAPRQVAIMGPEIGRRGGSWIGKFSSFCLGVSQQFVETTIGDVADSSAYRNLLRHDVPDPRLGAMLNVLLMDCHTDHSTGLLLPEHLATASVIFALNTSCELGGAHSGSAQDFQSPRLRRTCDFIEANLGRKITLQQLAANAGMSVSRFCISFKARIGLAPHQYILQRRIERAKKALSGSKISIVELADELGFCDQSQFSRAFKKIVGLTPKKYQGL